MLAGTNVSDPSLRYVSRSLGRQLVGRVASRICGRAARSAELAASTVWPGRRRAITSSHHVERASSQLRSFPCTRSTIPIGTATSNDRPTLGPKKPGGVTPTTMNGMPLSVSGLPIASAAPP